MTTVNTDISTNKGQQPVPAVTSALLLEQTVLRHANRRVDKDVMKQADKNQRKDAKAKQVAEDPLADYAPADQGGQNKPLPSLGALLFMAQQAIQKFTSKFLEVDTKLRVDTLTEYINKYQESIQRTKEAGMADAAGMIASGAISIGSGVVQLGTVGFDVVKSRGYSTAGEDAQIANIDTELNGNPVQIEEADPALLGRSSSLSSSSSEDDLPSLEVTLAPTDDGGEITPERKESLNRERDALIAKKQQKTDAGQAFRNRMYVIGNMINGVGTQGLSPITKGIAQVIQTNKQVAAQAAMKDKEVAEITFKQFQEMAQRAFQIYQQVEQDTANAFGAFVSAIAA